VNSAYYEQITLRRENKHKWKTTDLGTITFSCPYVVIDMEYDDYMTDKEKRSTVSQLQHLYGALRQSSQPLKVTLTSVTPQFRSYLDRVHFESWKIFSTEKKFSGRV